MDRGDPNFVEDANETDIDGNPRIMGGRVDMGADEDYPHCDPNYSDWVLSGRPNCWMTPYQCDGDAAVDVHRQGYRVYNTDLRILSASWKAKFGDSWLNPCADFNHQQDHVRGYRVYNADLGILSSHWTWKDPQLPGDCVERGCGEAGRGGSEPAEVTSEDLLDWLAEIWLDPEVRKQVDADAWLKLYQSLNEF